MAGLYERASEAGRNQAALNIGSAANMSYAKRADRLLEMARSGDRKGLKALAITGVNTYAKALRLYRDGLLESLKPPKARAAE